MVNSQQWALGVGATSAAIIVFVGGAAVLSLDFHDGVPGFRAANAGEAFYLLGVLHARVRPLQTILLHTLARGQLAQRILPLPALVALDALVHRLDLVRIGEREAEKLDAETALRIDKYIEGISSARAWPLHILHVQAPKPSRASICSALAVSAYLGLAQGQERMERAITEALCEGADAAFLQHMFAPHLDAWDPMLLRGLPRSSRPGFASADFHSGGFSGGSNAWAIRKPGGGAILCGDPHLQINQQPAILCEVRARIGDDYWLGATIPGLPGLALGRNRNVAWSGTFACADNVDFSIEDEAGEKREVQLGRRFRKPLALQFTDGPRGTFENSKLCVNWTNRNELAASLAAYVRLPFAKSAAEADALLQNANTLSLHFVIADRSGDIRYRQVGRVAKNSSLFPCPMLETGGWKNMPAFATDCIASANEARLSADGETLATFPQPPYRQQRILDLLKSETDMRKIQCDLFSLQHTRLTPTFLAALPDSALKSALANWNGDYKDERGALAFEESYAAAKRSLAPQLGGAWFERMLQNSELPIWWCNAIDNTLARGVDQKEFRKALSKSERAPQTWRAPHMLFGPLAHKGPFPLRGSRATIWQGYTVGVGGAEIAVAPAYRFITDLSEDFADTALPEGEEIDAYLAGRYKRIRPPS